MAVSKSTPIQNKSTGVETTAFKFEVFLVGTNLEEYCKGYVKSTESECDKAAEKFKDGTVWALSKVAFDTYTQSQYISTPIPYRVDLSKSLMKIQDESSKVQEALRASMPSSPAPTTSVPEKSVSVECTLCFASSRNKMAAFFHTAET